jgi:hypothetical protein
MSSSINWSDAKTMLQAYQNNSKALLKTPPSGTETLKGFKIDKGDMQSIMNNPMVQDVIVMPAVKQSDLTKPDSEQSFTMIIAGLNSKGDIVENSAIDFMTPCPDSCPKNYPTV